MARTTQNLDTGEHYEKNRAVAGKPLEELTKPLPLKGKEKTAHLRVAFYSDPYYRRPNEADVYDEVCGNAVLRRTQKESTNPGVHPDRWFKTRGSER
eukprot:8465694-Pyramimonas_sp.AAC.1